MFPLFGSKIQIIAHRGASKEAPENTIKAFKKAIELKSDYIEFDVHLSPEKVPIVIHDLAFVIDREKYLVDLLTTLKGEKIPTLEEVLRMENTETGLMIEIKEGSCPYSVLCDKVLEVINNNPPKQNYFLASMSLDILSYIKKKSPDIPLMGICEPWKNVIHFLNLGIDHLAIAYPAVNYNMVSKLHQKKVKVWVWTVDQKSVLDKMIQCNIDGIITNDVKNIRNYLYCNN
jgi:glycerophosphoryl diester phosphodiesterase